MLFAFLTATATAQAETGRFLAMADIHFDPLKDPSLADKLAHAPAAKWADLLAGGAPTGFRRDTDWTLLNQTLDAMRQAEPRPDFLLIPGDFLAHRLDTRFKQRTQLDAAGFVDFQVKTLQAIAQQVQQRFPGVPILPVLGNNDDSCGDYRGTAGDATMASTLAIIRAMIGFDPDSSFQSDWTRLGTYDVPLPGVAGVRLIALDNVFLSAHFRPCEGAVDQNPDATLLAWLHDHLAAARQAGAKVWLMMHIPPGTDVYETVTGPACPAPPGLMWKPADLQAYRALEDEFADIITAQFAGHTHMAEFRLVGDKGFVIGVPGVSPIYLQNPAFDLVSYRPDGTLTDLRTVAFSNFADVTRTPAPAPLWQPTDFNARWSVHALDGASLRDVARRLTDRPPATNPDLAHYLLDYSTGHAGVWDAQHIDPARAARAMACAAANTAPDDVARCDCPG